MTAEGLLLVDKPRGPTSHDAVAEARRRLGVRRIGHAGTLDPMASGLLPLLVGEATKLVPYLQDLDKEYAATVRLGVETDSYDAEGRVAGERDASAITVDDARAALARFVGAIRQRPPAHSAIKVDGKRLYERARAGEEAVAPEREVVVHAIDLVAFRPGPRAEVDLVVRCGKGTYIRSIAHDLGAALAVGGHLVALRRTRIGPFSVEDAVDPFASPGPLPAPRPLPEAVAHLPAVAIDPEAERRLRMGQQQALAQLIASGEAATVRLLDGGGRLVAIAERGEAGWALGRVFASPPDNR